MPLFMFCWRILEQLLAWWGSAMELCGMVSHQFAYTVMNSAGSTKLQMYKSSSRCTVVRAGLIEAENPLSDDPLWTGDCPHNDQH